MAIQVTCPGCFKRFEVSDKFAGMKGPCPSCRNVIEIPKTQVTVHAPEDFIGAGKTVKGRAILKPIDRHVTVIGARQLLMAIGIWVVVFAIALLIGYFRTSIGRLGLDLIGTVGLTAVAFAMSIFCYCLLRSGDDLEFYEGEDLYKRAGIATGIYAFSWILFELFSNYMGLNGSFMIWVYLIPLFIVGTIAAYAVFDLNYSIAFVHYSLFLICIVIFRWAIGLGWIWMAAELLLPGTGDGPAGRPPAPPGL